MRRGAILLAAGGMVALAACHRQPPAPEPSASAASPEPSATAAPAPPADTGALDERRDPERLLRFYADALAHGRWDQAARAWRSSSGVDAATLKASYDRGGAPAVLTFGKAEVEGGAGSLYYEAPVTIRFGPAPPERGTLTLRRVNDVPGASAEQLVWRIERSTIGATQ